MDDETDPVQRFQPRPTDSGVWWHALDPGEHFVAAVFEHGEPRLIYGEVVSWADRDVAPGDRVLAVCYDAHHRAGAFRTLHLAAVLFPLAWTRFALARSLGWPDDVAMVRALAGCVDGGSA